MQPFFTNNNDSDNHSDDGNNDDVTLSNESMALSFEAFEQSSRSFDDKTDGKEGVDDASQLSPRAEQTLKLMRQYNSLIEDAKIVYSLAQEEDATDEEKVDLIFQYNEMIEKGKKILDRIEAFGYFYKQEEMDNGFRMDGATQKLKNWID